MIPSKELFVLADFSCGRYYTHHSSYLKDFFDFLTLEGKETQVWVNTSADSKVVNLFGENVKACLRSNLYSYSSKTNLIGFLMDKLMNRVPLVKRINPIRNFFITLYLKSALKEFEKNIKSESNINLIFPTLDGLGLQFIRKVIVQYADKISLISVRITNAETRGTFGESNSLEILKKLISQYPNKINIGFEVEPYNEILEKNGIPKVNIFWSPMPFIKRNLENKYDKKLQLNIGFIGSARKNKGFDEIPSLVKYALSKNISTHFYIQLPIFKWPRFHETFKILSDNFNHKITFIDGATDKSTIDNIVENMDLVVLPYYTETYRLAGSGILFISADYSIPIASSTNLGFNWDIESFNLGFTFSSPEDFANKLLRFKKSEFSENFKQYNLYRAQATKKFLKL